MDAPIGQRQEIPSCGGFGFGLTGVIPHWAWFLFTVTLWTAGEISATSSRTVAVTSATAGSDSSSSAPWIGLVALAAVIALIAAVALVLRSRAAARRQWLSSARDLALRSENLARRLDEAAVVLAGPVAADRQVWLDANETMTTLVASATALLADAPRGPDDPPDTNSLATTLGGSSLFISTWLIERTGDKAAPGIWMSFAALCGRLVVFPFHFHAGGFPKS